MQQKFGGDERFKLDERFAEHDVTGEENMADGGDIEDEEEDVLKEKEMNRSVLEQVLGKSIRKENKERYIFVID